MTRSALEVAPKVQSVRHRFTELDGLRGVAAIFVVFCHLTFGYDGKYPSEPDAVISVWWGAYGVQLFFMISGFVILMTARRARRVSDFVISRVTRLYPAYWIALVLAVTWSVLFAIPTTQLSWSDRLLNIIMVQRWIGRPNADEVYWTLAIEMQFYVLIVVMLLITRCRLTERLVTTVSLVWVGVALVLAILAGPHSRGIGAQFVATEWKLALNAVLAEYAPLFVGGMFAHLARTDPRYRWPAVGMGFLAGLVGAILHDWTTAAVVWGLAALFLVVALRSSTPVLRTRVVQWLGKVSYSLYIVHNLLAMWIVHLLVPSLGRTLAMLVTLVPVLAVARLVHELGEVRASAAAKRWLTRLQR